MSEARSSAIDAPTFERCASGNAVPVLKPNFSFWNALLLIYVVAFFILLYAPIFLLALLSINDSSFVGLPVNGVTFRWYSVIVEDPALRNALSNSVLLGIVSATIATALALLMAMGFRRQVFLRNMLLQIILLPIVIPGVVGGVVLVIFFGYLDVPFGIWTTTLVAHVNWALPFAFLTLYPRLHQFDRSVEEAAMDLGATPLMTFRRVVFPMIRPAVIATFLFAFTLSFDEFIRTLFLIGTERTVPTHLWTLVVQEMSPFMPAVGMTITLISIAVSLVGFWVSGRDTHAQDIKE
jgi:ABC-type spermidine/putrescine transport system permease subunit II